MAVNEHDSIQELTPGQLRKMSAEEVLIHQEEQMRPYARFAVNVMANAQDAQFAAAMAELRIPPRPLSRWMRFRYWVHTVGDWLREFPRP